MAKEILFPAKSTFTLADYADPALADDEIRGSTLCSLISQGTELGWASGDDFPVRPGYAAVFMVEEIGANVEDVKVGDLRFCMGYHRSTQQYPARFTLPVPDGMSPETALFARLMGVSMTTLMTTTARPGDKVIITGAGPVGFLAAHLFSIGGYDVAVVEKNALRRSQVQASGITQAYEKMPLDDETMLGNIALVVDCSGHEGAVLEACQIVGQQGEVVLIGVPWKQLTDISAHEVLKAVFFNFVNLRSGWEWQVPILSRGFVWEELLEGYNNAPHSTFSGFRTALKWLSEDRIKLDDFIHHANPQDPSALYISIQEQQITEPFIVLGWQSRL